jgi:hypothetical protein
VTIVSHKHRFIFLKTRKTAGTSIERWLMPHLGSGDMIATPKENWPVPVSFLSTPNPTTRFPTIELKMKKWLLRNVGRPTSFSLREHMNASSVRAFVGEDIWQSYFKFCIERQPWDRMISFWRWRQHRRGSLLSMDDFLALIESDPNNKIVRNYSNLEKYTIGGRIVVDQIVRYENLNEELARICHHLRIPACINDLTHVKGAIRPQRDTITILTDKQIDRIGHLSAAEIRLFGWQPPASRDRRSKRF